MVFIAVGVGVLFFSIIIIVILVITGTIDLSDENGSSGNCVGEWSVCDTTCVKTYSVSVEQSGTGSNCEASDGDTASCSPGEGSCPGSVQPSTPIRRDCVGQWENLNNQPLPVGGTPESNNICGEDCQLKYNITQESSDNPESVSCPHAHDAVYTCTKGQGQCGDRDAVCNWGPCLKSADYANNGVCEQTYIETRIAAPAEGVLAEGDSCPLGPNGEMVGNIRLCETGVEPADAATRTTVLATYAGQESNRCPWVEEMGSNPEYDPCTATTSAPNCLNGGTCVRDPNNRRLPKCDCQDGYSGVNCENYTGIGCAENPGNCCEASWEQYTDDEKQTDINCIRNAPQNTECGRVVSPNCSLEQRRIFLEGQGEDGDQNSSILDAYTAIPGKQCWKALSGGRERPYNIIQMFNNPYDAVDSCNNNPECRFVGSNYKNLGHPNRMLGRGGHESLLTSTSYTKGGRAEPGYNWYTCRLRARDRTGRGSWKHQVWEKPTFPE